MGIINHSFLELKTPKDSIAASLNNKTNFLIYQEILKSTTINASKNKKLFTIKNEVPEARLKSWGEMSYPLKRLMEDSLIQQLLIFQYNEVAGLTVGTCFIAAPLEKADSIYTIYENILDQSIKNIHAYLDNSVKFNANNFKKELEANLTNRLPLTPINYPENLTDIFWQIEDSYFDVPLEYEVRTGMIGELEDELIHTNKIIKMGEGIYLPITPDHIKDKFEATDDFIKTSIYPLYKQIIGNEIEAINENEEEYRLNPFHEISTAFPRDRAEILHSVISPKYNEHYPGELAIMTVLLLEPKANEFYQKEQDESIKKKLDEYRNIIINTSEIWQEIIHFFAEETLKSVHPKVWSKLQTDKSLTYAPWYLKKESIDVYAPRNNISFQNIIKSMNAYPPDASWKILAFKNLLETNEHLMPNLFTNQDTIKQYGNLLKKAYLDYFPWYYPILVHFKFFRDIFFTSAKAKIQAEQLYLRNKSDAKKREAEKKAQLERKKNIKDKASLKQRKELIECMDILYFKDNIIPTRKTLLDKCNFENSSILETILHMHKFQFISISKGDGENSAILYPMDHEWRGKESRLKNMLHKKIEAFVEKEQDDKKYILPYKLLYNYLTALNKMPLDSMDELKEDTLSKFT